MEPMHRPLLALLLLSCGPARHDSGPAEPIPRPEHPRPDWQRDHWSNLNGPWSFAHDPDDKGLDEGWHSSRELLPGQILVPFAFEAAASGLGEPFPEDGTALQALTDPTYQGVSWYHRVFEKPAWDTERAFLVFGAVDWRATVWLNGVELGSHEGGWLPFSLDATQALQPGLNHLVLRVDDPAELEPDLLIGKQGGTWYTRSSGIWQTVYLEGRPAAWLEGAWFFPDWQTGRVELQLEVEGEAEEIALEITDPRGGSAAWSSALAGELAFELTELFPQHGGPALWSPADPALYRRAGGHGGPWAHSGGRHRAGGPGDHAGRPAAAAGERHGCRRRAHHRAAVVRAGVAEARRAGKSP